MCVIILITNDHAYMYVCGYVHTGVFDVYVSSIEIMTITWICTYVPVYSMLSLVLRYGDNV